MSPIEIKDEKDLMSFSIHRNKQDGTVEWISFDERDMGTTHLSSRTVEKLGW